MRGQHRVVHPEAALAVSAGITGITFAAVVAVMAVQHVSQQATDVRNTGQTPPSAPTTTTSVTPPPPATVIVQQPAPQTKVLVVTKEAPAPPPAATTTNPPPAPEPRDLTPSTPSRPRGAFTQTYTETYKQLTQTWPSFSGNVFDLFVR
jgi:outer membrane biosynthesis protein TonB